MITDADILAARILIVDDQEARSHPLEQMLGAAGYATVAFTRDPREICSLHRKNAYDLIVLDLLTPDLDDFAVLEQLRGVDSASSVAVLVVASQTSHKLRALQLGARDVIGRPFDLVEMQARIRNLLEVRLLSRQIQRHNEVLEQTVLARTAELRASEERFQRFTELSSDCYWEQDASGRQTHAAGRALQMLGLAGPEASALGDDESRWNSEERAELRTNIAARRPFLDLICSRIDRDGTRHFFQISGEPFFGPTGAYAGYRGIALDVTGRMRI